MTGNQTLLSDFQENDGPRVMFGDSKTGKTKGIGTFKNKCITLSKVSYVEGLKFNLISISQLCDKGYDVLFSKELCQVKDHQTNQVKFTAIRNGNLYAADLDNPVLPMIACFHANSSEEVNWLWHRRLSHLNFKTISDLVTKDLVRGLPKVKFDKVRPCKACQLGKQTKISFKSKLINSNSVPLELIHMDLFGPVPTTSLGGKSYTFVIVDDFTRFTWTYFLAHKNETCDEFVKFMRLVENQSGHKIKAIRSDRGTEFDFSGMDQICDEK